MKFNKKNIIKYLGNIVTIFAIFFVFKQLLSNGVEYQSLFKTKNILPMILVITVQAIIVVTNTYPWKKLVEMLSNKKLPISTTIQVYVKANIMKYVPGNVFQYVGRNELAVSQNISHIKVATATVLDVGMTVLSALFISLLFLFNDIWDFVLHYVKPIMLLSILFIFIAILAILVVLFKKRLIIFFQKNKDIFRKENLLVLLKCFIYYVTVMLVSSLMYMIVYLFILDQQVSTALFLKLFSAYTLSWLVGFVTPGAPAGIGIKEAVMVSVSGGMVEPSTIALSMIVLRILATISDVLAFAMVTLIARRPRKEKDDY